MARKSWTIDAKTWTYTVLMVLVNESNMGIPSKDDQMSHSTNTGGNWFTPRKNHMNLSWNNETFKLGPWKWWKPNGTRPICWPNWSPEIRSPGNHPSLLKADGWIGKLIKVLWSLLGIVSGSLIATNQGPGIRKSALMFMNCPHDAMISRMN